MKSDRDWWNLWFFFELQIFFRGSGYLLNVWEISHNRLFHFFQLFFKIFNFSLQFLFHVFLLLVFHLFSKNSSRIARSRKPPFNSFLWCCWTLWWKYSGFVWMFACGSSIIIFIFLKLKKKIQANKILHHFQIFIMRFRSKVPKKC